MKGRGRGRREEEYRGEEKEQRMGRGRKEINHLFSQSTVFSVRVVSTGLWLHHVKHFSPFL